MVIIIFMVIYIAERLFFMVQKGIYNMPRGSAFRNSFQHIIYEGCECVRFQTVGKHVVDVIVDKEAWDKYLSQHTWTVSMNKYGRASVKTSIANYTVFIWNFIIEHEYDEIDYWGQTIDHVNNNPLDNRLSNLRIYNAMLNGSNVSSKFDCDDRRFIHEVKRADGTLSSYKIHYNLGGEAFYIGSFSIEIYGSKEAALSAAKEHRDKYVILERKKKIEEIEHKARSIEFERGLKRKLEAGETDEIVQTLQKYDILISF